MTRHGTLFTGVVAALAGSAFWASALAAEHQDLLVRAIGQPPSQQVVAYVAAHAEPRVILEAEQPEFAQLTAAEIAAKLCGSLPDGYLDALAAHNPQVAIESAALAGAAAFTLRWPACLEVRPQVTYTVRRNDNPTAIRLHLTGEFAAGPELDAFFAESGLSPRTAILQPGQTLRFPFETLKTRLTIPADRVGVFGAELKVLAGRRVQVELPRARGALIGPAFVGSTLAASDDCVYETDDDYPFNALEVANAYDDLKEPQNTVYVAIVDNGFFGVPCSTAECPSRLASESDYSSRFPKRFFARPQFYKNNGTSLGVRNILGPLNYPDLTAADVTDVSGHGTHVAGLALGGPTFVDFRSRLADPVSGTGRIALSIVAVSRGALELDAQTEDRIGAAINAMVSPMLVNLSIAFDDPKTETTFRDLLHENNRTLFVAAAGNKGQSLEEYQIFPAALGGKNQFNLLTVASIDSTGALSGFSNYGAATDIAAPGCKIVSWLNAEGDFVPISGTSQAAPMVTFGSALLLSKMPAATPRGVKNRLIYSGDLIRDADSREKVWSGAQLSIPKALFVNDDYVAFRAGQETKVYLGRIERFGGVTCGTAPRLFDDIRSLKRASDSEVWVYTETGGGPVSACQGRLASHTPADPRVEVTLAFTPHARIEGASIVRFDAPGELMTFRASELIELVRGMADE